MKKITLLLVIIFTFLFSTTSWGEWELGSESVTDGKMYYDKDRVRKNGKSLYFWMLHDYGRPSLDGTLSVTTYTQLDCSIFRYKDLKVRVYDKSMGEGEITSAGTPLDEWNYPLPNSVFEYFYKKICEEHQ